MKRIALLLCFLLTLSTHVRAEDDSAKVLAQLKEFYRWYMHGLNTNERVNFLDSKHRPQLKKYVSADFLKRLDKMRKGPDGLDGDPFIDAQDWDRAWEKNIEVKDVEVTSGVHAKAKVSLGGKEMNRKLDLKLTLEDGLWKISDVKALD